VHCQQTRARVGPWHGTPAPALPPSGPCTPSHLSGPAPRSSAAAGCTRGAGSGPAGSGTAPGSARGWGRSRAGDPPWGGDTHGGQRGPRGGGPSPGSERLGRMPAPPHPANGVILGEALGAPDLGGPPALLRPLRGGRGLRARGGGWSWTLPGKGVHWVMPSPTPAMPPHLAAGDEGGRGAAVQGLQALQHARQLLQLRLALRQLCDGHRASPLRDRGMGHPPPAPYTPSRPAHRPSSAPAPRCPSARRPPSPGSWRGQEHCPRAGSVSTGPAAWGEGAPPGGLPSGDPRARTLPRIANPRCHPPGRWWGSCPRDPRWGRARVSRPGDGSRGCSPSWRRAPGT